jgi:hypothetical protein
MVGRQLAWGLRPEPEDAGRYRCSPRRPEQHLDLRDGARAVQSGNPQRQISQVVEFGGGIADCLCAAGPKLHAPDADPS